jgi:sulfate/thiosulfate transport system ATP-binding protein
VEIQPAIERSGSERRGRKPMSISVRNITKQFGRFTALKNVDLEIPDGQLVALLGPSGCGKTTLLRIIAGLEFADSGTIQFDGQDITDQSARERRVGFVFQHYALFRHLTVFENIAFGLRVRPRKVRPSEDEIRAKVHELLGLIQLENQARRYPSQLSGGQRQRVALARALAVQPKVLLLDEPFGALDAKVRLELRRWLRKLHDEVHITSVFVTHDQEEALEVADRVAVMNRGRIEQFDSPEEVYDHPATPFVVDFLGSVNIFHGRIESGDAEAGTLEIAGPGHGSAVATLGAIYVRPHELELKRERNGDASSIEATVVQIYRAGPQARVELRRVDTGEAIQAQISRATFQELALKPGEIVFVKPLAVRSFDKDPAS